MTSATFLAQMSHFLGGAVVILLTAIFSKGSLTASVCANCLVIIYVSIKEFWYDANFEEPKQTSADNRTDFIFYIIGLGVSDLIVFIAHLLHRWPG